MKKTLLLFSLLFLIALPAGAQSFDLPPVSYTHLTLPTIYSV